MKTTFLQPKFEGTRFSEHTLPLDVAKDLAAYENLVIELAKHLYLRDHPERQRVAKGFAGDFHLHLERVDEGSARPLLAIVAAGALALTRFLRQNKELFAALRRRKYWQCDPHQLLRRNYICFFH